MSKNSGKNSESDLKAVYFIFLIVLTFLSSTGNAQIDIQRYTTATDTFYWKRYIHIPKPQRVNLKRFSVSHAAKKIDSFLEKNPGQFPELSSDPAAGLPVKDLKKCLYPVDINGDKLPDMIYSGYGGGESDIVRIWLNRGERFDLVFEDYQYISKFIKSGGVLAEMQTSDIGFAGNNYLYFSRQYKVRQEGGELMFVRGRQVVEYQYTEEPMKLYPEPIPFIAKADTMLLRASAAQQNEPFNPKLDTFGNIIAKYRSKARGMVLAYKSNGRGNDWFFVEISPSLMPSASILYGLDKMPVFIRGWVSSQSIQLEPK